ncbi:MAG TPA: methionyl-tRNA formyltransferase [Candidatus Eremiobacteraceae bacterium]|nr:methionyl-tRNA formyltransferase [Candidatus Eremiobacteraceae bacterium]
MFRVVFFGTSAFGVPILRALAREHEVVLVVTQPDRPAGRGLSMSPSPVGLAARELGLSIDTPEKLDAHVMRRIGDRHANLLACASYGKILPASLVTNASMPALNVHPSALPKYRGATPIQGAILAGDTSTAVTVMWMAARMDAGDIALQIGVDIEPGENYGSLHDRLAAIGANALLDALALHARGSLPRMAQDEDLATYTRPIAKTDLELRFTSTSQELADRVRAFSPKPGAWIPYAGRRLKVLAASPEPGAVEPPGTLSVAANGEPVVATVDGRLRLTAVVPEGKRAMSGRDFGRGLRV